MLQDYFHLKYIAALHSELCLHNMLPPHQNQRGRVNANYARIKNNETKLGKYAITIADDVEPLDARNLAAIIVDLIWQFCPKSKL